MYKKMKIAWKLMQKHIYKFALRRRFRALVLTMVAKLRRVVKMLQRVSKWRRRYRLVFEEIERRIEKKREEERLRKEEEERLKREEEERRRKEEEEMLQRQREAEERQRKLEEEKARLLEAKRLREELKDKP